MSVDTKLYLNGHVKPETLLKIIQRKFDPEAQMIGFETRDYTSDEEATYVKRYYRADKKMIIVDGRIEFNYKGEQRSAFYFYDSINCYENLDYYTKKGLKKMVKMEKTYLSLGCWGNSVEIMKQILDEFEGGWLDENDCDDVPFKWIPSSRVTAQKVTV